ncbi:hypothetical protein [Mesorhizobium sp. GbtcB19]|uniref:hypothetical protein n=1 Tax=Mesorhizobium sp. GbtcB19 TaxID=2824764 RepID=UPI001C306CBE|nr:hypothetical protein [Mesorhizobium sp. GbtcB19]
MVCATVEMLSLTRFAARFSGLCQETVKAGTAAILAAYRAIGVKMRPDAGQWNSQTKDAVGQPAKPAVGIAARGLPQKKSHAPEGGGD